MLRPMMQQIIREEVRKVLEGQDVSKINREMPTEVDLMEERTAADGSDYETECSGCYQCISQGIKSRRDTHAYGSVLSCSLYQNGNRQKTHRLFTDYSQIVFV